MIFRRKQLVFVLGNCLLLIFLSACSLAGEATPEEQAAPAATLGSDQLLTAGNATLICSTSCSDRAQCGLTTTDQQSAVLLASAEPAVRGHDIWQPDGAAVTINSSQPRTVQKQQGGEQYSVEFYQVTLADQRSAWVAGWCIQQ